MTSHLIKQTQCSSCAEKGKDKNGDNLAIYSDGHEWCYSCGFYKSANGITKFLAQHVEQDTHEVYLPHDSCVEYPYKALKWLEQYELSKNDLMAYGALWSESMGRLIFPIYGETSNLIAWQGRWFGEGVGVKWYGKGNLKDTFNILGRCDKKLVLVEDIISTIKLSKITQAMPLYGSYIGLERWKRLIKINGWNKEYIIWLDKDKQSYAFKETIKAKNLAIETRLIVTDLDPKEYSLESIKEILC